MIYHNTEFTVNYKVHSYNIHVGKPTIRISRTLNTVFVLKGLYFGLRIQYKIFLIRINLIVPN